MANSSDIKIQSFCFCAFSCLVLNAFLFISQGYGQADPNEKTQDVNILDIAEFPFAVDLMGIYNAQFATQKTADSNTADSNTMDSNSTDSNSIKETPFAIVAETYLPKSPLLQDSLFLEKRTDANLGQQLWQNNISQSKEIETEKSKNELQNLIKQINAIEFKIQEQLPETVVVAEPNINSEPNEAKIATEPATKQPSSETDPNVPHNAITNETIKKLQDISQDAEKLPNPFELAEILFNNSHLKEAAIYYKEALRRIDKNEDIQPDKKAWILLQIGNCLQNDDPKAAIDAYSRIVNEYNRSQWTDLAQAKIDLIKWYMKDQPESLIKNTKQQ